MSGLLKPGYGEALRAARAAKSLSPADAAAKLKLSVRQIESLEAEDLAALPGELFVRGFVRNYARLLDINPDELIVPMDAGSAVSATITAHSEELAMTGRGVRRWVLTPLLVLLVFVALVGLLYQWLSQGEDALVTQNISAAPDVALAPKPEVLADQAPAPAPEAVAELLETEPLVVEPLPAPASASASDTTAAVPPASAPEILTPPAPPLAPPAPPAPVSGATHALTFSVGADAWIHVTDGQGKRYSRLLHAGSSDTLTGAAPFQLVVGEAAQVKLTYDGRPIDLKPFIGQKVARLTLE